MRSIQRMTQPGENAGPIERRIYLYALSLCAIVICASAAAGQCVNKDAGINAARYREATSFVDVWLTKPINGTDLAATGTANHWKLFDLTASTNVAISMTRPNGQLPDGTLTTVLLDLSDPLKIDHDYR